MHGCHWFYRRLFKIRSKRLCAKLKGDDYKKKSDSDGLAGRSKIFWTGSD
jgi:hypothetical protein